MVYVNVNIYLSTKINSHIQIIRVIC